MKFFSNDAKETTEDQAHDDRDVAAPGSVEADPNAVPQQRAGSPWNDAPGTDGDLARDDYSRDETRPDDSFTSDSVRTDSQDDVVRPDSDDDVARPDFQDDVVRSDPQDDVVRSEDDVVRTDDGDVRTDGDEPVRSDDEDATTSAHTDAVDLPLDDDVNRDRTDAEQGFGDRADTDVDAHTYGPDGTVTPAADEPVDTDRVTADEDEEVADTSADFEPAVAAVPVENSVDTDTAGADVVAVPVDQAPGSVAEPKIDRLFTDGDSFAERFREIQLRFVDSPKDATAEAATLVGEAVDRLTSSLKSQQEGLSSKSEDTEQLRVELRGYRDMLNRLTAL